MPRRPRTSRALRAAVPTPIQSTHTTPLNSAYPSTYPSEVELDADEQLAAGINGLALHDFPAEQAKKRKSKPFPFLDLPSELRIKVYGYYFADAPRVVDLDPDNHKLIHKKLGILRVCRTVYMEAAHVFYTSRTFRVFPTHPGRFFKTKRPLLARMTPGQRANITSLELRLGPGWGKPPKGWAVNPALGLADCVNVRRLTVFVEVDPGDSVFNGFRRADGFYEGFSRDLLTDVLREIPLLERVEFDAGSSVNKSGAMVAGLLDVALAQGRQIGWGPERGWSDLDEKEVLNLKTPAATATALLNRSGMNVVVMA